MSTRIKGVALKLTIGTPGLDYYADVTSCKITNEDGDQDVITFADAAAGDVVDYFLNITAVQSTDPTSLWSYIWDHSGEEVAFTYAPHGNAEPTATQPHLIGMVEIGRRPEIGGEAGKANTYTFETQWKIIGVPTMDRGD